MPRILRLLVLAAAPSLPLCVQAGAARAQAANVEPSTRPGAEAEVEADPAQPAKKKRRTSAKKRRPREELPPGEGELAGAEPPPEAAAPRRGELGLGLKLGSASFSGDFSEEKGATAYGLMLLAYPHRQSFAKARGGFLHKYLRGFEVRWMIDLEMTSAEAVGGFYGGEGKGVGVTLLSVSGLACALADLSVQVCPYIGIGHLALASDDDDGRVGVFPYGLLVPYKRDRTLGELGFLAGAQLQLYSYSQTTAGKSASLAGGTLAAFFGIVF